MGILVTERRGQRSVVVAQADSADAAVGGGHEQAAQRAGRGRVADPRAAPAAPVGGRCHAELRAGALVEPAAGPVAGLVECAGYAGPVSQLALEAVESAGVGVLARGDAEDGLEAALQVVRARAHMPGELSQRGLGLGVLVDETAHPPHALQQRIAGVGQVGPAAAACAKASPLGDLGNREELHLLALWAPAGTGGPTVDAG